MDGKTVHGPGGKDMKTSLIALACWLALAQAVPQEARSPSGACSRCRGP
jgi:hypothetical protein